MNPIQQTIPKFKKYHMDKNVKTINPHYPIFGG